MNPKGTLVCEGPSGTWWEQRMRAANQKRPRKETVGDGLQKLTSLVTDGTGSAPTLTPMFGRALRSHFLHSCSPSPRIERWRTGKNFLFQDISLSENGRVGLSSLRSLPNTA